MADDVQCDGNNECFALADEVAALKAERDRLRSALESVPARVVQAVAELPDRTSPDDWPEAMLVTGWELAAIVEQALAAARAEEGTP